MEFSPSLYQKGTFIRKSFVLDFSAFRKFRWAQLSITALLMSLTSRFLYLVRCFPDGKIDHTCRVRTYERLIAF
jgi:hypothetical protein